MTLLTTRQGGVSLRLFHHEALSLKRLILAMKLYDLSLRKEEKLKDRCNSRRNLTRRTCLPCPQKERPPACCVVIKLGKMRIMILGEISNRIVSVIIDAFRYNNHSSSASMPFSVGRRESYIQLQISPFQIIEPSQ